MEPILRLISEGKLTIDGAERVSLDAVQIQLLYEESLSEARAAHMAREKLRLEAATTKGRR